MIKNKHQEDLKHIRNMMENSSRFISLSGLAGVFAGSFALIAAFSAYKLLSSYQVQYFDVPKINNIQLFYKLISIACITLVFSLLVGILVTINKSKKKNLPIWTQSTYKMLENLFLPLITGGVVCLAFFYWGDIYYIAPSTLIFYGLALLNASKYTFGDIKYLGICEILLGLLSLFLLGYGLFFWAIGFGVLHIVYGIVMQVKYK